MPNDDDFYFNVGELIEALLKYDKNKFVLIEGCDCYGLAASIEDNKKWRKPQEWGHIRPTEEMDCILISRDQKRD